MSYVWLYLMKYITVDVCKHIQKSGVHDENNIMSTIFIPCKLLVKTQFNKQPLLISLWLHDFAHCFTDFGLSIVYFNDNTCGL